MDQFLTMQHVGYKSQQAVLNCCYYCSSGPTNPGWCSGQLLQHLLIRHSQGGWHLKQQPPTPPLFKQGAAEKRLQAGESHIFPRPNAEFPVGAVQRRHSLPREQPPCSESFTTQGAADSPSHLWHHPCSQQKVG